jgi:prophage regulatory protein
MNSKRHEGTPAASPKLLRLPAVMALVGLGKTAIYEAMAKSSGQGFPVPVRIGARAVAWREHEVVAWIESRAKTKQEVATVMARLPKGSPTMSELLDECRPLDPRSQTSERESSGQPMTLPMRGIEGVDHGTT